MANETATTAASAAGVITKEQILLQVLPAVIQKLGANCDPKDIAKRTHDVTDAVYNSLYDA